MVDRSSQTESTGTGTEIPEENRVIYQRTPTESANAVFKSRKVFNDPIHGQIELHPACALIIDTPQFQRLRHIKQLDTCYLVYPGASHNRFEHSLGVCHLAGKLLRAIRERQPEENISDKDILCVEIAGLCHDLGQGPFSHVFEKKFIPMIGRRDFTHENTAAKMFKFLLENDIGDKSLKEKIVDKTLECGIPDFSENDFTFITEMIDVPKDIVTSGWPYRGRDESKSYMYEIVANKRNGIDVDKWDYLARDSYMLGLKVSFDHNRCLTNVRVIQGNGEHCADGDSVAEENQTTSQINGDDGSAERDIDHSSNASVYRKQICYDEKVATDLCNMFHTRMTLHRQAYQHKTIKAIDMMVCDVLIAANESSFRIKGKKISETVDDMSVYTYLNDEVIHLILNSEDVPEPGLDRAKKILNDILKRRLFKCIAQTHVRGRNLTVSQFTMQFEDYLRRGDYSVEEGFVYPDIVNLDCGFKTRDPMEKVRFYNKWDLRKPFRLTRNQVSYALPDIFAEQTIRIYCNLPVSNGNEENERIICERKERVEKAFRDYCADQGYPIPTMGRRAR